MSGAERPPVSVMAEYAVLEAIRELSATGRAFMGNVPDRSCVLLGQALGVSYYDLSVASAVNAAIDKLRDNGAIVAPRMPYDDWYIDEDEEDS